MTHPPPMPDERREEEVPPWQKFEEDLESIAGGPGIRRALANCDLPVADDPWQIIALLRSRRTDPDEKDRVVRLLVEAAQNGPGSFADTLLMLGLFPALNAIYHRLEWRYSDRERELVAEIGHAFTVTLRGLNLDRVKKVAATLVRSTERTVRRHLAREWRHADRHELLGPLVDQLGPPEPAPSPFNVHPGADPAGQTELLRRRLRATLGADVDVVICLAVNGWTVEEVARELRLHPEAVKSRYRRARAKLRRHLGGPS